MGRRTESTCAGGPRDYAVVIFDRYLSEVKFFVERPDLLPLSLVATGAGIGGVVGLALVAVIFLVFGRRTPVPAAGKVKVKFAGGASPMSGKAGPAANPPTTYRAGINMPESLSGDVGDVPPAKEAAPKESPTKNVPLVKSPTKEVSAKETTAKETPAKETGANETPATEKSVKATPTKEMPAKETPRSPEPATSPASSTPSTPSTEGFEVVSPSAAAVDDVEFAGVSKRRAGRTRKE